MIDLQLPQLHLSTEIPNKEEADTQDRPYRDLFDLSVKVDDGIWGEGRNRGQDTGRYGVLYGRFGYDPIDGGPQPGELRNYAGLVRVPAVVTASANARRDFPEDELSDAQVNQRRVAGSFAAVVGTLQTLADNREKFAEVIQIARIDEYGESYPTEFEGQRDKFDDRSSAPYRPGGASARTLCGYNISEADYNRVGDVLKLHGISWIVRSEVEPDKWYVDMAENRGLVPLLLDPRSPDRIADGEVGYCGGEQYNGYF